MEYIDSTEFATDLQGVSGLRVEKFSDRAGVAAYELDTQPYPVAVVMNLSSGRWDDVGGTIVPTEGYGDHIKAFGRDSVVAYIVAWLSARDDVDFTAPSVGAPSSETMSAACVRLIARRVDAVAIDGSTIRVEDLAGRVFELIDAQGTALVRFEHRECKVADNSVEGLPASVMAVMDATSDESDD